MGWDDFLLLINLYLNTDLKATFKLKCIMF